MKIFLDTADITDIIQRWDTGLISGITTNPTLVKKSGMPYHALIEEITNQFPELESVSAEVSGETADEMIAEAETYIPMGPVSYTHLTLPTNREV